MRNRSIKRKLVIVGQAPPMRKAIPFARTRLFDWFYRIGVTKEHALQNFGFTALVSKFPGKLKHGHRPPSEKEIQFSRPRLIGRLKRWQPTILVPVGSLAIRESLGEKNSTLASTVGKKFWKTPFLRSGKNIAIIPLPHPSGASPWIYNGRNSKRFARALRLLRAELEERKLI